jgi:hypothetical protein
MIRKEVRSMWELVEDALLDSLRMVPWLLVIYALIELMEMKWGSALQRSVMRVGKAGPALGAAVGLLPQCGFSVIASSLYAKRLLTIGTLMAVYLATSDEAIPVILAHPEKIQLLWPLLASKFAVGLVAGYLIDALIPMRRQTETPSEEDASEHAEHHCHGHRHGPDCHCGPDADLQGCCNHAVASGNRTINQLLIHPLRHTGKVFVFLFLVTLLINYVIHLVGEENLGAVFYANSLIQPVIAAFIGLIPNCAASVAITEGYLQGALSFGSVIAGLSANAGVGILVLLRENERRDTLRVIGMLLAVAISAGLILQLVM